MYKEIKLMGTQIVCDCYTGITVDSIADFYPSTFPSPDRKDSYILIPDRLCKSNQSFSVMSIDPYCVVVVKLFPIFIPCVVLLLLFCCRLKVSTI